MTPSEQAEFRTSQLYGRVFTVIVWIEADDSRWSPEEKRAAERAVRSAERWIVRQASAWGTEVSFATDPRRDLVVRLPALPRGYDSGASHNVDEWIQLISPRVGWRSPGAFLTRLQLDMQVDHAHLLLLVRREGRSYAAPNLHGLDEEDALSVAACFFDTRGTGMSPATIAHELLHLYGAWDLYKSPYHCRAQAMHAARLFPADIMQDGSLPIEGLSVKELTAWRLGWRSTGPAWFEYFAPLHEGDEGLLASRPTPPRSFEHTTQASRDGAARPSKQIGEFASRTADVWRRLTTFAGDVVRQLERYGAGQRRISKGRVSKPRRAPRLWPTEQLLALDPMKRATFETFSEAMSEVLREHSMREAHEIARTRPSPRLPGRHDAVYAKLMIEWATIRRLVEIQRAGGAVEEERLQRAVQEWMALSERIGARPLQADLARVTEAYRRSVLILDSIQRRQSSAARIAVLRFRHLERQMRSQCG